MPPRMQPRPARRQTPDAASEAAPRTPARGDSRSQARSLTRRPRRARRIALQSVPALSERQQDQRETIEQEQRSRDVHAAGIACPKRCERCERSHRESDTDGCDDYQRELLVPVSAATALSIARCRLLRGSSNIWMKTDRPTAATMSIHSRRPRRARPAGRPTVQVL